MTTIDTLTDDQIATLRAESAAAGDLHAPGCEWVETRAHRVNSRTDAAWWDWHDADSSRWSADTATAEDRCAAWVEGTSDDGPEVG